MSQLIEDVRYSTRSLRRAPTYTAGVVLTLSLVIALTVTVLGVIDRVLLRALPFQDASALVDVFPADSTGRWTAASYPAFRDWVAGTHRFTGMGFARGVDATVRGREGNARLTAAWVSRGYFRVLGARAEFGRLFAPDEESATGGGVAVLSHAVWLRQFGGDPRVIGQPLRLDSGVVTVVGVLPATMRYPSWADIWLPIEPIVAHSPALQNRFLHVDTRVLARLAPGTTLDLARSDLETVLRRLAEAYPDPGGQWTRARFVPLRDEVLGNVRPSLLALGGAACFILLIACANVANLALVRASTRGRELAVRAALGAGRGRIARQVFTEGALLAAAGGVGGVVLAVLLTGFLRRWAPSGLPRVTELGIDGRILLGAVAVSTICALLTGLVPAGRAGGAGFAPLRATQGSGSLGARRSRLRAALTVAQMSLALMLLAGTGLLVQSSRRLHAVDLGYEPEHALVLPVFPPRARYPDEESAARLYQGLVDRLRRVPGVVAAGFVNHVPLSGWMPTRLTIPGRAPSADGSDQALYKTASDGYLEAAGLTLVRGRWLNAADEASRDVSVVVSEQVARRYWPNENPLGRSFTVYRSSQARPRFGSAEPVTVVGVVADVRHFGPGVDAPAEVYLPFTREVWDWGSLVVRVTGDPRSMIPALTRAALEVEPDLPVAGQSSEAGFRPLTDDLAGWYAPRRIGTLLVSTFSLGAMLLAALGLYTITSYAVAQRTGEIGVRMALGATPGRVLRQVLREGLVLAVVGAAIGGVAALGLGRVLRAMLYDTSATDPVALLAAGGMLTLVVVVAVLGPARRASRLDPTVALRSGG